MVYTIKLTEIRDEFEKRNADDLYIHYIKWAKTFIPFWKQAIIRISELIGFDEAKKEKHLKVVENAFEYMENWRFGRIKYVKARRNEIDSAISFIRNHALDNKVSKYFFSPLCRSVASVLRGVLYASATDEGNTPDPTSAAQHLYEIAFIHTLLPYETSNFIWFLPKGKTIHTENRDDLNNYHLMLENAAKKFEITEYIQQSIDIARKIWENFETPFGFEYPDEIWTFEFENMSAKMHFASIRAFHKQ